MTLRRAWRTAARRLVGAVLLALLMAQWLGLSHAIAHAPRGAGDIVAEGTDSHWGHDAGTPTCSLIDHLLLGESAATDAPALACMAPDTALASALTCRRVCGATRPAYEARGPPRV